MWTMEKVYCVNVLLVLTSSVITASPAGLLHLISPSPPASLCCLANAVQIYEAFISLVGLLAIQSEFTATPCTACNSLRKANKKTLSAITGQNSQPEQVLLRSRNRNYDLGR